MASQTFHLLQPRLFPELLSLVIPVYNEQAMIGLLREKMTAFLGTLPCPAEVVLVNDGSSDRSMELLLQWAREDERIKVLGFARNFGHQVAVTGGLDVAQGDAIVIMDADLQDPPEVVLTMLERYREGYDVVYAQRSGRTGESIFKRWTAWAFYRFMRKFIHKDLPADTGDFRLMSRRCLDAVRQLRETHRFLRGMVAWVGFPQIGVPFTRPARAAGETKYPLTKMIRFAWTAATSFSAAPLRLSLGLGVFTALFGVAVTIWAITVHLRGHTVQGWTSMMAVFCVVGGAILLSIGVLGEYIGRIFEEIKGRPLYIVSTKANIADDTGRALGRSAISSPFPPAPLKLSSNHQPVRKAE